MRDAGERASGGSSGRRQRPPLPGAPQRAGGNGGASLFTPAYRVSHAAPEAGGRRTGLPSWAGAPEEPDAAWSDGEPSRRYDWADDGDLWSGLEDYLPPRPATSNAVRGFPPRPDDPLPVYPPGPFAAWNRRPGDADAERRAGARREDPARQIAAASITPVEFDTDYSLPAIKDPDPAELGLEPPGSARSEAARPRPAASPRSGGSRPGGSHGRQRPARRRRAHARHGSVRLAVGAAALTVLVATSLRTAAGRPGGRQAASRPPAASSSSSPAPPAGKWQYIGSRATDPQPLTLTELFPPSFSAAGVFYRRSAQALSSDCHGALIGSGLQSAVHHADCTQAARASYLARAVKMMGTIGVFNLKSAALAQTSALAAGRSQFVAQLPARTGPTKRLGQGTGIEEAVVKGHYLVLGWAEFTGLSAPKTAAERARLTGFLNVLIQQTVNASLSARMVTGKPAG